MHILDEFRIDEEMKVKLKDKDFLSQCRSEGKLYQHILGYSQETMEKFYLAAYSLFQKEQYEKAADAFLFLVTLNPKVHNFWLGLGMAEQMLERYTDALFAYQMSALSDEKDPLSYFHAAKCYFAIRENDLAQQSLDKAIKYAKGRREFDSLRAQAKEAKALLLQDKGVDSE